ncbi:TetR/AcrR family transcriptional regulator [Pseudomonas fluorescens]|jgi:AcrR family transcriptional regulator|uniref:TetR family transcriptional regulator n=1 Tax=Pseudomonas aylmerensis TaxID=1869229 RepID=A0A2T4G0J4_9PSED|nr:TetR/AcrR family transcriptional regulator [Pseudomonas aylmerensis]MBS7842027.1 TetR/AcrR family transcriptional regulator [Pseudomonas fluorescens]OCW24639.1 TetR family transcriptional regulator [Pseudomonas aylmerensis]PTC29157.1 TetR/AcrR family transcriptional regulator [Pseudomonas aylmerensis]
MSRARAEIIEDTRARLIASARLAFATQGYANTSMDDFTARAGLTRGALYHHFGDKKGLLAAVVAQLDGEMDAHLQRLSDEASDPWSGFCERCRAYLRMAQDAEIQRIVLQDAPAVLGDTGSQQHCVESLRQRLDALMHNGVIPQAPSAALAQLINGSLVNTALWIARDAHPGERLEEGLQSLELLLRGLKQ